FSAAAFADEGMWMVPSVNKKTAELCNYVVSIDFMGTGSLISAEGLVITNHHVAYGDVFALSNKDHNYLEDGFWAHNLGDEIPIPGRHVQFLRGTVDVTAEVQELIESKGIKPGAMMMRKIGGIMEKRYHDKTGYEASLSSAWRGDKYYISLYEEYRDIRLVGAPPARIGAYGGDIDNWEWPQHKGDFALLRIYTAPDGSPAEYAPSNIPLKGGKYLKISLKGYREGSKTTIIGFPGSTDRYASSAKADYMTSVQLPIQTAIRGEQMNIIKKWMDRDPEIRRKYSNFFFGLSNAQELYLGELQCYKRFKVADRKRLLEAGLDAWLDADPARRAKWGDPVGLLKDRYAKVMEPQRNFQYFRECIIRGTQLEAVASRTRMLANRYSPDKVPGIRRAGERNFSHVDLRVERELFRYSLETFYENVDEAMLGPYQSELKAKFGKDYDAMCHALWDSSWISRPEEIARYLDPAEDMKVFLDEHDGDPLVRFFEDVKVVSYNNAVKDAQGTPDIGALTRDYTHAMYAMQVDRKLNPYPDANSTMRVNFGKVMPLNPRDAVSCSSFSTVAGLLEKHDPDDYDFCIPDGMLEALKKAPASMHINFITNNDSTGGNSGSPVLNSRGELIGLLFDGNKESLASEMLFTPGYNRSVNVDIRYVVWILREYARFDRILSEIDCK
ncbi:MAG: S46 family peptidase, partial [Bacteroidales bacterium]|nr:S46 family peptidase [Bacteroidales bacterium]